jgi:SAM-dependent methyltransferase
VPAGTMASVQGAKRPVDRGEKRAAGEAGVRGAAPATRMIDPEVWARALARTRAREETEGRAWREQQERMFPPLFNELAEWWPLISPPADQAPEAWACYGHLTDTAKRPVKTILELGSGGGHLASHLKQHAALTLVDVSGAMLDLSRQLNPQCEHELGDMRALRLKRTFDAVLIHDSIMHLVKPDEVSRALATASNHCAPGGAVLVVPEHVRETFRTTTRQGGGDDGKRGARWLEWAWDPSPDDTSYVCEVALMLRAEDGTVASRHERLTRGLFPTEFWLAQLTKAGFEPRKVPMAPQRSGAPPRLAFTGLKPS